MSQEFEISYRWRCAAAVCALICWHGGFLGAAPQKGKIEVTAPGSDPRTVLRLTPAAGSVQRLAYSLNIGGLAIRGRHAVPEGEPHAIRGEWAVELGELQEDGFSYQSTLSIHSVEPPEPALDGGFHETTVKDFQGVLRSIATGKSIAKPFGLTSVWVAHRALDIVFPPGPVGQGAQWKVTRSMELDEGLEVDVDLVYELKILNPDSVGVVYSIDTKRQPVDPVYVRKRTAHPSLSARSRLYLSVTCSGRAIQSLSRVFPDEAELLCQVTLEIKQGNRWAPLASGEQIEIQLGQVSE